MKLNSVWKIRLFVEVAETLSFTRAAERMHIGQPSMSRQIRELEATLGAPLFDRAKRHLALTESGQVFLRHARTLLQSLEDAEEELISLRRDVAGPLAVGISPVWDYLLPKFLGSFKEHSPKVTVELTVGDTEQIARLVVDSKISLGFVAYDPHMKELDAAPIGQNEIVIIAPAGHELARGQPVRPSALNDVPMVMPPELVQRSGRRDPDSASSAPFLYLEYLEGLGVRPKVIMTLRSIEAIKGAVWSGLGLGVVSQHAVDLELTHAILTRLCLDAPPYKTPLYVLRNRFRLYSRSQHAFVEHVRKQLQAKSEQSQADQHSERSPGVVPSERAFPSSHVSWLYDKNASKGSLDTPVAARHSRKGRKVRS